VNISHNLKRNKITRENKYLYDWNQG